MSHPQANITQYATGWVPEPSSRGTWEVLYTCLFTLFLCVYSAIHINIPAKGEPRSTHFWRKVKWVFVAIVAPEIVLYSAWQQYRAARRFCLNMDRIRHEQAGLPSELRLSWRKRLQHVFGRPSSTMENKKQVLSGAISSSGMTAASSQPAEAPLPKCSLTYGFYVVMGGLVVEVHEIYDNLSSITLTPEGALSLARKMGWKQLYVSDETINDKSKADNLGKLLVFFQVLWTLLQCISRQVSGYPLAVLEVHTLVHAACAMLMYGIWFYKPLSVCDPTSVDGGPPEELALDLVRTPGSAFEPYTTMKPWGRLMPPSLRRNRTLSKKRGFNQTFPGASEASFLIFDKWQLRLCRRSHRGPPVMTWQLPFSPESASDLPIISILDANESFGGIDVFGGTHLVGIPNDFAPNNRRSHSRVWPSDEWLTRARSCHGEEDQLASFYRLQCDSVDEVKTLTTGQTLASGIGPAPLLTVPTLSKLTGWRGFLARLLGVKWHAAIAGETHEIHPRLQALLVGALPAETAMHKVSISLSKKDLLRWHRAALAFAREIAASIPGPGLPGFEYECMARDHTNGPSIGRLRELSELNAMHQMCTSRNLFRRAPNLSLETLPRLLSARGLSSTFSVAVISGIYAGVHLALWNHGFPTQKERCLWRLASCALTVPFVVWIFIIIYMAIIYMCRIMKWLIEVVLSFVQLWGGFFIMWIFILICGAIYHICRIMKGLIEVVLSLIRYSWRFFIGSLSWKASHDNSPLPDVEKTPGSHPGDKRSVNNVNVQQRSASPSLEPEPVPSSSNDEESSVGKTEIQIQPTNGEQGFLIPHRTCSETNEACPSKGFDTTTSDMQHFSLTGEPPHTESSALKTELENGSAYPLQTQRSVESPKEISNIAIEDERHARNHDFLGALLRLVGRVIKVLLGLGEWLIVALLKLVKSLIEVSLWLVDSLIKWVESILFEYLLPFVIICGIPIYLVSRLYIVVESFLSLRHVPVGVYERVTWAQYIPHF